ncbi:hypothetical protein [Cohnella yongneupensis]|uniref:Uncharacterized protein n=1 Tax=Cohnella yongneupensis TaxID=425006 RepID=A0ABW0R8T2_9BACL
MATLIVRVPDDDYDAFKTRCGSQKKTISGEIRSLMRSPANEDFLMNLGRRLDVIAAMLAGDLVGKEAGDRMRELHLDFDSMKQEISQQNTHHERRSAPEE